MDATDLHHPHESQTTKVRFFSTARETQKTVSWDSGTVKTKRKILREHLIKITSRRVEKLQAFSDTTSIKRINRLFICFFKKVKPLVP